MKKSFAKTVLNLKDAIAVQPHAIVSKTIVSAKESSLTLFAFDAGESIDTHSAPVEAVVYVIEGEVDIVISEKTYALKEGELIHMPKGEPHALTAKTRFKMALFKV